MKTISLIFLVHQPLRLKTYRFFNMGRDHNYLDDSANRSIMQRVAKNCYLPMNALLLKLIKANKGKFKVSFYISGIAVEQFRAYAPDVLKSFRELAATGSVEFMAGSYSNSLAALADGDEFADDVRLHTDMLRREFGVEKPAVFCNTALLYSDAIGEMVADMGFKVMIAEGAKHILGWKSPNYVYAAANNSKLRLLLRNNRLSDDIAFRFSDRNWSEWPLTADKFAGWLAEAAGEAVNLCMDYDCLGEWQKAGSGIFDFIEALPGAATATRQFEFGVPSEAAARYQPTGVLYVNHPTTWADEERDVSAWLGNELQKEAFTTLYEQRGKVKALDSEDFNYAWRFLQTSNHFYYMATKWFSDGDLQSNTNPYPSSYEAFINYMNVLNDFIIELDRAIARSGTEIAECVIEAAV